MCVSHSSLPSCYCLCTITSPENQFPVCHCHDVRAPRLQNRRGRLVLASHWKVNDKATSQLMTEFIRHWRSGEPRAQAWREAQLSLLHSKDFSNPYFWAAFTLHRPVEIKVRSGEPPLLFTSRNPA